MSGQGGASPALIAANAAHVAAIQGLAGRMIARRDQEAAHGRQHPKGGCYWCEVSPCPEVRFVTGHGWVALCGTCMEIADGR